MIGEGDPRAEPALPEWLDEYVLRERIGQGGMGVVHRAVDPRGGQVAVKLLHPHVAADEDSRTRFAREARVLSQVRGQHVAEVLDADVVSETPYLVTRFVNGRPLSEVVAERGPLQEAELAGLARGLADALVSIHAADIVHRDLKPANVLVEDGAPVVIDFGIAQLADESRITRTGLAFGTPGYVAPEVLSENVIGAAGDVHAWAATVAYAATGRHPFGSGPLEAVAFRVLQEPPDLEGCPAWLRPVLDRCLLKHPEQRPTANELVRWLETGHPPAAAQTLAFPEQVPRARPLGSGEPESADAGIAGGVRVRHGVLQLVTLGMLASGTALAAVLPTVAMVLVAGWLVLARTVDRAVGHWEARRRHLGSRRSDGVVATLAAPWHLGRSVLVTALTAPVAAAVGVLAALLVTMVAFASGSPARLALLLAIAALVGQLSAWFGFGSQSIRRGNRRLLVAALRSSAVGVAVAVALALGTMLLMSSAAVLEPEWWPLPDPFASIWDRVSVYIRP